MSSGASAGGVPSEYPIGASRRPSRPSRLALIALLLGLLVTAGLAVTARVVYDHNETRLLQLRGRELDLVLGGLVPQIEAPLASAVQLADIVGGNSARLDTLIGPDVGASRTFTSVSLWRLRGPYTKPVATIGAVPQLAGSAARVRALLQSAHHHKGLESTALLGTARPALLYAYAAPSDPTGYAIYAESPLPKSRRLEVPRGEGLAGLHYSLYLGRGHADSRLLLTDLANPPGEGQTASFTVPFGSSSLTLVVSPNGTVGTSFFAALPWIFGGVGLLVTLAAALMTDRLVWRRRHAEELAGRLDLVARENRELYTEQRGIAQTLQHALLPESLASIPGLRCCARYVPSAQGIDVGGDWYDLIDVGDGRALMLIGDVSGHGLPAATTMAALRHAALAYAAEDPQPSSVLSRLASFVGGDEHAYFATLLCGLIDIGEHTLTLASAGHPAPLVMESGNAWYPELRVGVPIGVRGRDGGYDEVCMPIVRGCTLLAYTDGLVERRGESLDVGLARLREAALTAGSQLEAIVERLADELGTKNSDDTAILGVRWES